MGGYGSGRWAHHRKKATVEAYYCVDIATFKVEISRILQGRFFGVEWSMPLSGSVTRELCVALSNEEGVLFLRLAIPGHGVNDTILLTSSEPHYGGRRWWLTCPQCRRRVRKIYWSAGCPNFRCRKCRDLAYRSQRRRWFERQAQRIVKIKGQLGARGTATAPAAPTPLRPKGMRETTYWRLVGTLRNAERRYFEALAIWTKRFNRKNGVARLLDS